MKDVIFSLISQGDNSNSVGIKKKIDWIIFFWHGTAEKGRSYAWKILQGELILNFRNVSVGFFSRMEFRCFFIGIS